MNSRTQKPFELTGRHAFWGFGAFFGTLIAVQAAFITIAVYTHTGLVSTQPYRKGLDYGERIALAEAQEKLGWNESLEISKDKRTMALRIADQYGMPVRGLRFEATIVRGVTVAEDRTLSFEATGDGTYAAKLPIGLAGTYITDIAASKGPAGGEIIWRMRKRVWLQP